MTACSACGAVAPDSELPMWTHELDDCGRATVVCPACTREHVRAIEAKLDRGWW